MTKLKSITIGFVFLFTLLSSNSFAQEFVQNEKFTYAPLFNNQVVLVRETPLNYSDIDKSFQKIKEWGKERYASAPLISNIRYDNVNKEIVVKSKIELLLPENSDNIREKVVMKYHLNVFILNNKCVFEVKGITYKLHNIRKSVNAEDIITPSALKIEGPQQELRVNIEKSTLYFFNELADSLVSTLNSPGNP